MIPLNLPQTELKLTRKNDQIFVWCPIRKKKLVLTPEEWVRQHFIAYLINDLDISQGRIVSEFSLSYNNMSRRADIVVMNEFGQPYIIVECKAPQIPLSDKTFFQIAQYQNSIPAKILILTNGLEHLSMKVDSQKETKTGDLLSVSTWHSN
jgi:hypothetical protein|tara:strand:- start:35355 stop:35807 length:453 start_codon:yes stop_codon:yes gene_type:complete